jgi:hypothetical protein
METVGGMNSARKVRSCFKAENGIVSFAKATCVLGIEMLSSFRGHKYPLLWIPIFIFPSAFTGNP